MENNIDPKRHSRRRYAPLALLILFVSAPSPGAGINVRVRSEGAPVANAVIYARPADGRRLPRPEHPTAVMDQKNREFVPHVLPVLRGTTVSFPNSDQTRHQVYSFSGAKTFELPLYEDTPAKPVVFGETGVVALGCNIHDWMLGYILVVDTPAFDKTGGDGSARLTKLPAGAYTIRLWHPRLRTGMAPEPRTVTLADGETLRLNYALALKPPIERERGFAGWDGEKSLEEQF